MSENSLIQFTGECYERFNGFVNRPIEDTLRSIAGNAVEDTLGVETVFPDPVAVEVSPYYIDEPGFMIRAWHRLKSQDWSERLHEHHFSFNLHKVGRKAIIQTERERQHVLCGESAIFLAQLATAARKASGRSICQ